MPPGVGAFEEDGQKNSLCHFQVIPALDSLRVGSVRVCAQFKLGFHLWVKNVSPVNALGVPQAPRGRGSTTNLPPEQRRQGLSDPSRCVRLTAGRLKLAGT
jgi:hypothetical protein